MTTIRYAPKLAPKTFQTHLRNPNGTSKSNFFGHFPIEIPIEVEKITHMGRKGPRAKTKIVLESVSKVDQLGSMHNLKFPTLSK